MTMKSRLFHIEALDTFVFLKKQIGTGYYEDLIRRYLLENPHGAIVVVKPEKGRTARMDRELREKLAAYKDGLSREEREELVTKTRELEEYQSKEDRPEDLEKIPVLNEKTFPVRSRLYSMKKNRRQEFP